MTTQSFLFNQADDLKVPGPVEMTTCREQIESAISDALEMYYAYGKEKYKLVTSDIYESIVSRMPTVEIEWQIRGRHHYEWRKTTEALAAEMHRVNPLHVRAVTVLPGLVPKGQ